MSLKSKSIISIWCSDTRVSMFAKSMEAYTKYYNWKSATTVNLWTQQFTWPVSCTTSIYPNILSTVTVDEIFEVRLMVFELESMSKAF